MPKTKGSTKHRVKIECPNCNDDFTVSKGSNKWCEWIDGSCWTCGYRFQLKDKEFDFIQPDSPFFDLIYKFFPKREYEKNKKIAAWNEQKRKEALEEKYHNQYRSDSAKGSFRKPWEKKVIEREVLNND